MPIETPTSPGQAEPERGGHVVAGAAAIIARPVVPAPRPGGPSAGSSGGPCGPRAAPAARRRHGEKYPVPEASPRSVNGSSSASGEVPRDVVVGEQHPVDAARGVGLVVAQPPELGRRERRHQHAPDRAAHACGPPISAMSSAAAAAERMSFHSSASCDRLPGASRPPCRAADHRPHRAGASEQGRRPPRGVEPGARVDRRPFGVGGRRLRDDRPAVGIDQERLGGLGGGVDAEDQGSPIFIRLLN